MLQRVRRPATYLMAFFFVSVGVGHFTDEAFFVSIVPDWIPWPRAAVIVSGVAEIAGGVALAVPRAHLFARWWLLGLLVAVFPANIDMALNPHPWPAAPAFMNLTNPDPVLLYLRLPVQFVMMGVVWWITRRVPDETKGTDSTAT